MFSLKFPIEVRFNLTSEHPDFVSYEKYISKLDPAYVERNRDVLSFLFRTECNQDPNSKIVVLNTEEEFWNFFHSRRANNYGQMMPASL